MIPADVLLAFTSSALIIVITLVANSRLAALQVAKPVTVAELTALPVPDELAARMPARDHVRTSVVDGHQVWVADQGGLEPARWIAVSVDPHVGPGLIRTTYQTNPRGSATSKVIGRWNRIIGVDNKPSFLRIGDGWMITKVRLGQACRDLEWDKRLTAYIDLAQFIEREAGLGTPTVEPLRNPTWHQPRELPSQLPSATVWEQPNTRDEPRDPDWR